MSGWVEVCRTTFDHLTPGDLFCFHPTNVFPLCIKIDSRLYKDEDKNAGRITEDAVTSRRVSLLRWEGPEPMPKFAQDLLDGPAMM